jgi:hypothetical protein
MTRIICSGNDLLAKAMASLAVLSPGPLLRAGLAALLSTMGFDLVEEAADLEDPKRRTNRVRRPDVLLMSASEKPGHSLPSLGMSPYDLSMFDFTDGLHR